MKITFKDGITIEVTDYESKKEAIKQAKNIHKEYLKDKAFKDSFRITDNKAVKKSHIYDSYEDATDYINYLEKTLNRHEINFSNIYLNEEENKIVLEFNNKSDTQKAFELILDENIAEKQDLDYNSNMGIIVIDLND